MLSSSDDADSDSRQFLLEGEENAPEGKRSSEKEDIQKMLYASVREPRWSRKSLKQIYLDYPYELEERYRRFIIALPKSTHRYATLDEMFAKFDEIAESYGTIDILSLGDFLREWKSTKQLVVKRLHVDGNLREDLMAFLNLVQTDTLNQITIRANKHQAEILDLSLIQKPKRVVVFGGLFCPDDKLMQIDAEQFINHPKIHKLPFIVDKQMRLYTVLETVERIYKWIKGPKPKICNSPSTINQYIKKCLFHLDTKNHQFWLWPHDNYDIQTILSGIEIISSGPFRYGTFYVVNSTHREFVFAVFLLEIGVFGRRIRRYTELPTLKELLA